MDWSEPDTPNGIVRQYIISYNQSGSDVINATGTDRKVTIGDLLPSTFYEFTVVAVTVTAGLGASDTVQTHAAGLCVCMYMCMHAGMCVCLCVCVCMCAGVFGLVNTLYDIIMAVYMSMYYDKRHFM